MRHLLFDLEGTTTSLEFVNDELFTYARKALPAFVQRHARYPVLLFLLARLGADAGRNAADVEGIITVLLQWMDEGREHPDLKELQGLIWADGYRSGVFMGHLYPDVVPFWQASKAAGVRLAIYSSGSVLAQRLLLRHSIAGNVAPLIDYHFDARIGARVEAVSYEQIATAIDTSPSEITFFSDALPELDAARAAGLGAYRVVRPGVPALEHGYTEIQSFGELGEAFFA